MRIITGSARGAKLLTLEGDNTRPTPERVKESVFSMIQFDIEGRRVLDLFAGSGQLGLEELSRGAEVATLADSSKEAIEIIKSNARKTRLFQKCRILQSDYKDVINASKKREQYDIIFLDPPYASDLAERSLSLIKNSDILAPGGIIIVESNRPEPFTCDGMELKRHAKYGIVYITLLEKEVSL